MGCSDRALKEEVALNADVLHSLKSKFDERVKDEQGKDDLEDEDEPGIALEDQLRITEQSAKAIDLLTNHLFSTSNRAFVIRNVAMMVGNTTPTGIRHSDMR